MQPSHDETVDATGTDVPVGAASETGGEAHAGSPAEPRRGSSVGRYLVLDRLGAGAMGVVFAAYDPELDRRVALKLLRAERGTARARLQREARALARLSHPNVVAVHDVGEHEGRVFVAMEHLDGDTLTVWRERNAPGWRDVVRVFSAAGEGLAAAHAEGLVHRDFKPDNVMIDRDGRPRVLDFGIARGTTEGEPGEGPREEHDRTLEEGEEAPAGELSRGRGDSLTRTGALIGTPAYMSPEQFAGTTTDARSDQFSFCAALFEALYATRPFRGETLAQLATAVSAGELVDPPRGHGVPAWVGTVVRRGLSADPNARWPDMRSLLAELDADPGARRGRFLAMAGAAALVVGAGFASGRAREAGATDACAAAGDNALWSDERRSTVEAALRETGLAIAETQWSAVDAGMNAYAAAWKSGREDACRATASGTQSTELLDRRMACYDARMREAEALVGVLERADAEATRRAATAVTSLPALDRCADVDRLLTEHPPPADPVVAAKVDGEEQALVEARALVWAGRYGDALPIATESDRRARELGHPPLMARAAALHGEVLDRSGEFAAAEGELERAYSLALEHGLDEVAAESSAILVLLVGRSLARPDEGKRWGLHAEALARATGDDAHLATALANLGTVEEVAADYPRARALQERALELRIATLGAEHPQVAMTLNNLGSLAETEGRLDEARTLLERSVGIWTARFGADHPMVALPLTNLGTVAFREGKLDEAEGFFRRALAVDRGALGPAHADVAGDLNNLGSVAYARGDLDAARAHMVEALEVKEAVHGSDHPDVAMSLSNLGAISRAQGDLDASIAYRERALTIFETALGPDHPDVARTLQNLGGLAAQQGRFDVARRQFERALEIREAKLGVDHPDVAMVVLELANLDLDEGQFAASVQRSRRARSGFVGAVGEGHAHVARTDTTLCRGLFARGQTAAAIEHGERAVAALESGEVDPLHLARARQALAQALRSRDPARSKTLDEQADAVLAERGTAAERARAG